jgi:glycosyltransferase involved in cell wall biosynthesis
MNIILNGIPLIPPLTGIGYYTHYLRQALQQHPDINRVICIPNVPLFYEQFNHGLNSIRRCVRDYLPGARLLMQGLIKSSSYLKLKKIQRFSTDVIYHETAFIFKINHRPKICTVHDLSHIYYAQCHPSERVQHLLRNLHRSVSEADHIITGSLFSRQEILDYFKLPPEKVTTIYHGVDSGFKPRERMQCMEVLRRYNLYGKDYLLTVGALEPRKNLVRLIQAFQKLPKQLRIKHPLVLVGAHGWKQAEIKKHLENVSTEELCCLNYVCRDDLPYLYSGAYAFAYVSLYEGFGLPLLEALSSGLPVLSSQTSSMPEVVGDAALLVDPFDTNQITIKLEQLLTDINLREQLKHRSLLQAGRFSWQRCVDETIQVYRKVLV